MKKMIFLSLAAMFSLGALTACSDDSENPQDITCAENELYNPRTKQCVSDTIGDDVNQPDATGDANTPGDTDDAGNTGDATVTDDTNPTDDVKETPGDTDVDTDTLDPECDKDNDGHLSFACGGFDCDDNDPTRFPGQFEICNGIDDNCNGLTDELLECTFFAHTADALYKVNPFSGTLDKESDLIDSKGLEIRLLDIDTHPSGTLYGITRDGLYIFDTTENYWIKAAKLTGAMHANGMAIDYEGVAFITVDNKLFKLNLTRTEELLEQKGLKDSSFTGISIALVAINITPAHFVSSGDSVVNKQNTLFMTSKHDPAGDFLVEINRDTAAAVSIGQIGFDRIYGLTAAWNNLYGTTVEGELISIDVNTGKGTLVKKFADKRWYGAASSPNR